MEANCLNDKPHTFMPVCVAEFNNFTGRTFRKMVALCGNCGATIPISDIPAEKSE